MADLMRPAMYGAYHHITVIGKEKQKANHKYDAVGHFVACLEVTDNEGATSETCVGVNVLTR